MSGGEVFDEKPFKAYAANITPDLETGIGKWTEALLIRGIREGMQVIASSSQEKEQIKACCDEVWAGWRLLIVTNAK